MPQWLYGNLDPFREYEAGNIIYSSVLSIRSLNNIQSESKKLIVFSANKTLFTTIIMFCYCYGMIISISMKIFYLQLWTLLFPNRKEKLKYSDHATPRRVEWSIFLVFVNVFLSLFCHILLNSPFVHSGFYFNRKL